MNKELVCIVGCGWVGKALATELESSFNIECIDRDYISKKESLQSCKSLVISIPARGNYLESLDALLKFVGKDVQVVLYSSISFYKNREPVVNGEKIIKSLAPNATILRLGGLMGYNRVAGQYTAGKTIKDTTSNYIHRDDVIEITKLIIEQNIQNRTLDLVAPIQALKSKIFTNNSKKYGFGITKFIKFEESIALSLDLNYKFKKENALEFWK